MSYIRFVRPNRVESMAHREGFFCAAYEMREMPDLSESNAEKLEVLLSWFRQNLRIPERFNRTNSKGSRRRNTKGLSWFKDDATAAIEKSFELVLLLTDSGFPIEVLRTDRVGYIVYEDAHQVVAEPFADTPR